MLLRGRYAAHSARIRILLWGAVRDMSMSLRVNQPILVRGDSSRLGWPGYISMAITERAAGIAHCRLLKVSISVLRRDRGVGLVRAGCKGSSGT